MRLKWPNDLLRAGAKCAGILTETAIAPDGRLAWLILGNDATGGDRHWIETTLAQLNGSRSRAETAGDARLNPFRPTPETAKLAYLMLAKLGA